VSPHDPCACGSLLPASRCCALVPADHPLGSAALLDPFVQQATRAADAGDAATALSLCRQVLTLAPTRTDALALLYRLCRAEGALRAAEALLLRCVALAPNDLWAAQEAALMLLAAGRLAEAEPHARNAVRLAPENAQSHNLLAMILTDAQRPWDGAFHYRRALALSGTRDPVLLANLAWCLQAQGLMAEARDLYREAAAAGPLAPQALLGWARMEEADRRFDAAIALLERHDAAAPDSDAAALPRATTLGRMGRLGEAIATLDALERHRPLQPGELLERGRLRDRAGEHAAAFADFDAAKRQLRDEGGAYADAEAADLLGRLRAFFTAARLGTLPRAGVRTDVPQPIFILGFPRSGTTLVEQSLSAHPRIGAGDELPLLHDLSQAMPRLLGSPLGYPEALAELWMADRREGLDVLRDAYLAGARRAGVPGPGQDLFTDKMPLNETHIGLIGLVFPAAPIIHLVRHPLDVMVSAMSNHFTHGWRCGMALETAALHYARIAELVAGVRREMDLRCMVVRYEDIVANQEASLRAMLDFVGVPFDPACLRFHENPRFARTASYAQVTEKLHDRSRFRYRHYRRELAPAVEILRPTIEALGYGID
jgi:tetratricopeptide (TPR) repeat protein